MSARPLRWWSSARLAQAALGIERAWLRWCADWDVPAGAVWVGNACEGAVTDHVEDAWRPVSGSAGCLWLACGEHDSTVSLRELLFPGVSTTAGNCQLPGTMATGVAHAAWDELARALLEVVSAGAPNADAPAQEPDRGGPPAADARPWSGALRIRMQSEREPANPIDAHLRGPWVESFMSACRPSQPFGTERSSPPIVPWTAAFASHRLRLRIELDEVALALGTLQSLTCGDVLTLPHRLDEPLRVRLARADRRGIPAAALCDAALGARRGHRAVELLRAESGA